MANDGSKSTDKNWKEKSLTENKPQHAKSLIPQKNNDGLPFLTFSFRYCTQQEWFGIAGQDATWFANLQDRLKDLSGKNSNILEDKNVRKAYRMHPINWNAKNCPIKKEDLTSVPKTILDNAENDFFWQFQLSKGTGRVIGFFNEYTTVFYIVLLDPKHNIQPSKDYGYHVDKTDIAVTEYERIQMVMANNEQLRNTCKYISECPLQDLNHEYLNSDTFYACIDPELKETYIKMIEDGTFQNTFEDFLLKMLEKA